jgi:hypothetical protein
LSPKTATLLPYLLLSMGDGDGRNSAAVIKIKLDIFYGGGGSN